MDANTFACKLKHWTLNGFQELGDHAGCGIGKTTRSVVYRSTYEADPFAVSLMALIVHVHHHSNVGLKEKTIRFM